MPHAASIQMRSALLAVLLLAGAAPALADYREAYEQGLAALAAGNPDLARQRFAEAIEEAPEAQERVRTFGMRFRPYLPHYYLGEASFRLGDCAAALAAWEAALAQGVVQRTEQAAELVQHRAECEHERHTAAATALAEELDRAEARLNAIGPSVLRIYDVPPQAAEEIAGSVRYLVGPQGRGGRVAVLGAGRIAVTASEQAQQSVAELIDAALEAVTAAAARIRFEYWLVTAAPAPALSIGSGLEAIAPALEELTMSLGPMRYVREDYLRHSLRSGAEASAGGRELSAGVSAAARGARIAAELRLDAPGGRRVMTSVDFEDGETLVLGVVGAPPRNPDDLPQFSVFVIRASVF